jgi:flagellar biosynthesis chaperone FliJ
MNKKIIFVRSKDNSGQVGSATEVILNKEHFKKEIKIELVNLDKRNYQKFLTKLEEAGELPKDIYLWYDEEIVMDYITEKYPQIQIHEYSLKSAKNSKYKYALCEDLITEFRDSFGVRTYWKIKLSDIESITINNYDYEKLGSYERSKLIESEDEAKIKLKETLEKNIKEYNSQIDYYKTKIKDTQKKLKKVEKEINKKEVK